VASLKDRLAEKPVLGTVIRVNDRFGEAQGAVHASSIALQIFLSLIPLLLVAIAVVGFVAGDAETFTADVVDAFGFPADGPTAEAIEKAVDTARESRQAATVVGLLGLLWRGLTVVTAVQGALDSVWQTTAGGLKDKARALLWLVGAGAIFASSFALGAVINFLPPFLAPLSIAVALAVNVGLFLWTFTDLGRLPIPVRDRLPGAVVCAVGFEVLKLVGTIYVPRLIASSSALYGSLGIVVALLAWLAFFGRLLVYGAVVNVLRWEDVHGTVEVPLEAPRVDAALAVAADRSGAVVDRLDGG
jgi:membrane protein